MYLFFFEPPHPPLQCLSFLFVGQSVVMNRLTTLYLVLLYGTGARRWEFEVRVQQLLQSAHIMSLLSLFTIVKEQTKKKTHRPNTYPRMILTHRPEIMPLQCMIESLSA